MKAPSIKAKKKKKDGKKEKLSDVVKTGGSKLRSADALGLIEKTTDRTKLSAHHRRYWMSFSHEKTILRTRGISKHLRNAFFGNINFN